MNFQPSCSKPNDTIKQTLLMSSQRNLMSAKINILQIRLTEEKCHGLLYSLLTLYSPIKNSYISKYFPVKNYNYFENKVICLYVPLKEQWLAKNQNNKCEKLTGKKKSCLKGSNNLILLSSPF